MKTTTSFRRFGAALIAPALAAGMVVAAPSAQAAPNSYSYSAARWLSDQVDWVLDQPFSQGLALDISVALSDLDTRAADRTKILSAIAANPGVYVGSGSESYAGPTGKLATAVKLNGDSPDSYGGLDLISRVNALVASTGAEAGRASDQSAYGDYSNSIGQAWVVRALATSPANASTLASATAYLLKQQCASGAFRTNMFAVAVPDDPSTSWNDEVLPVDRECGVGANAANDQITIDATAFGIQALVAAKDAGVADLQDDINDATAWLLKQQAANGSFVNDDSANTNSTGLAAATLKAVGQSGAAGSAAAWIVAHQVTDANAEDTKLANELGAIAFDQDAMNAGKADGIEVTSRDQWIRATSQAAVGVNAQLPAKTFSVAVPTGYVAGGSTISVSAKGLAAGEKFTASVTGGATVAGTANSEGVATARVKTGGATATRTVTIKGSRSNRVGTKTVKVLGSKRLALSLASKVKKGKKQTVRISGLAAGESVQVYVAGKRIKSAKASSTGKYSLSFKVTGKTGKKTVKVVGQFSNRNASKRFTYK